MSHGLLLTFEITILVLAIFLGFEVISKVPTLLHTPLMSGTNAIHGIVIVGAMIVAGADHKDTLTTIAMSIPIAPIWFPRRAVAGFDRKRNASTKVTIVTRYSRSVVVRLTGAASGAGACRPPRPVRVPVAAA